MGDRCRHPADHAPALIASQLPFLNPAVRTLRTWSWPITPCTHVLHTAVRIPDTHWPYTNTAYLGLELALTHMT
jgi:hypothetical protein